jgi:hypothetical protein
VHGQLLSVMFDVTLVLKPAGGADPFTLFNVIATD